MRRHDENRLREELEEHLVMQTAENVRAGLSPVEARRQAVLKFGSVESVKADYRDAQRLSVVEDGVQDVGLTLRKLRRSPLFTLTTAVSLAMGIGATAAVFTVIERVLLRPLPVSNPHELVYIADERVLTQASPRFSYPFYAALQDNRVLSGITARAAIALSVGVNGSTARVSGELVSGTYFGVLGTTTQIGRPLSPDDDRMPGAHPVAVISDAFWKRTFGSHPSAIGRDVEINGYPFTIVGVAARQFHGTDVGSSTDIWLPMTMQREVGRDLLTVAGTNWLEIIGRLTSGMTRVDAAEELTRHLQRRASELPAEMATSGLILTPGGKGSSPVRRELGPALGVLMMLTVLALGLACVNVASLVLVRSAARHKEIALRLALGARRSRLTRQLLAEGLTLATLGGTAGLLLAPWTTRMLIAAQPRRLEIDPSLDWRVLLFGIAATALTGLAVAQAPILASRRVSLIQAFDSSSARLGSAWRRLTTHDAIVTLQIAMALAMLIAAALLVQSLRSLNSVDPGFRPDNLLLASLDPKASGYNSARIERFWRSALERVNQTPGVQSASLAGTVPLASGRQRQPWTNAITGEEVEIDTNFVGPQYFQTLDIPLVRGREFDEQDGRTSTPVVIVNEGLARSFWPGDDPIGKGFRLPDASRMVAGNSIARVVGVVRDVKYRDLRSDAGPMIYRPVLQTYSLDAMTLHVRATIEPDALVPAIHRAIAGIDRNVPLFQVTTLEEQLDASFAQTRQAALLSSLFGILALLLSGIGVYGVTALAVARRTREIGIQLALGARPWDIVRPIGRRAIWLVAVGIGLGLSGALGLTQLMGSLVFGITAADGATFAAMAMLIALVCVAAFCLPVSAATRLDAVAAIRHE